MNTMRFQYSIIIIGVVLAGVFMYIIYEKSNTAININEDFQATSGQNILSFNTPSASSTPSPTQALETPGHSQKLIFEPIENALARITKKPFGIKISPEDSPVLPEKFSGYHTGVDFETFADEQTADIPIFAICAGKLVLKKYASGYGGVAAQSCQIENQDVMVVYGHLQLSSISAKISQAINVGSQIGVLGTGYSTQTDNERKHLHLGIHKGKNIFLLGYVQSQRELDGWFDITKFLK